MFTILMVRFLFYLSVTCDAYPVSPSRPGKRKVGEGLLLFLAHFLAWFQSSERSKQKPKEIFLFERSSSRLFSVQQKQSRSSDFLFTFRSSNRSVERRDPGCH